MLVNTPFYYRTIRNTTIAFGNLFNEIYIDQNGTIIKVPLQYLPKEKFVQRINYNPELTGEAIGIENVLPAMGFEFTGFTYAVDRKTNKMHRIHGKDQATDTELAMYNRTPYDVGFTLYIGARKLEESFMIVEQILPYFTPELTIKIKDNSDFGISTNIPVVLESVNPEILWDDSFEERRAILWTLEFNTKIFFYPDNKNSSVIRRTFVNLNNGYTDKTMDQIIEELVPFNANPEDDYNIKTSINEFGDFQYPSNVITKPGGITITGQKSTINYK